MPDLLPFHLTHCCSNIWKWNTCAFSASTSTRKPGFPIIFGGRDILDKKASQVIEGWPPETSRTGECSSFKRGREIPPACVFKRSSFRLSFIGQLFCSLLNITGDISANANYRLCSDGIKISTTKTDSWTRTAQGIRIPAASSLVSTILGYLLHSNFYVCRLPNFYHVEWVSASWAFLELLAFLPCFRLEYPYPSLVPGELQCILNLKVCFPPGSTSDCLHSTGSAHLLGSWYTLQYFWFWTITSSGHYAFLFLSSQLESMPSWFRDPVLLIFVQPRRAWKDVGNIDVECMHSESSAGPSCLYCCLLSPVTSCLYCSFLLSGCMLLSPSTDGSNNQSHHPQWWGLFWSDYSRLKLVFLVSMLVFCLLCLLYFCFWRFFFVLVWKKNDPMGISQ